MGPRAHQRLMVFPKPIAWDRLVCRALAQRGLAWLQRHAHGAYLPRALMPCALRFAATGLGVVH